MIVTPSSLQETTRRFLADGPLILISGVLAMAAGLAIVNTHSVWVLGGASRVIAPRLVEEIGGAMMVRPMVTRVVGACWALLGGFLTFKAYI
jgi:hypothetical protein